MNTVAVDFIHQVRFEALPEVVRHQARRCLLDLVGVAAAGTSTPLSRVARDHAAKHLACAGDDGPQLLFDGRRVSAPGAAFANAATIDSMDGHDGHRLTKGHAGAAVLPATLAFLSGEPKAGTNDLLTAMVVGYEIATRAGLALHANTTDYHSSGAWNAIGAAAIGARVLRLSDAQTHHAMGIAEYSAPRAPMMRAIEHPTMVKDSSAWGAQSGVAAALLAADGFTGAPAALLGDSAVLWADLGRRWRILEQYFKPYPVCRWAHPAIWAVVDLVTSAKLTPGELERIEVVTFSAATRLATREPANTEQAQYSLPFSVAAAAVHHRLDPWMVTHPAEADPHIRRLAKGMLLTESDAMTAAFPATRTAEVAIVCSNGRRLSSGPTTAPGDPESPLDDADLRAKFRLYASPLLGARKAEDLARILMTDSNLVDMLGALTAAGSLPAET